jgi:hypothetical protein
VRLAVKGYNLRRSSILRLLRYFVSGSLQLNQGVTWNYHIINPPRYVIGINVR